MATGPRAKSSSTPGRSRCWPGTASGWPWCASGATRRARCCSRFPPARSSLGSHRRTAQRELAEEGGLAATTWVEGPRFYTAPGFCTELMHLYLATDLTRRHRRGRCGRAAGALVADAGRRPGRGRRRPDPRCQVDRRHPLAGPPLALRSWHADCPWRPRMTLEIDDPQAPPMRPGCATSATRSRHSPPARRARVQLHRHHGRRIADPARIAWIKGLAIPPAWTDVWISPSSAATSRPSVATLAAASSIATTRAGARCATRRSTGADRVRPGAAPDPPQAVATFAGGAPARKVLALVVRLLEATLIRVGNEEYARENRSFGLTTLRDRHAGRRRQRAVQLQGKGGKEHEVPIADRGWRGS